MADFQLLDGDLIGGGLEVRPRPLRRPGVLQVEAHLLRSFFVEKDDRDIASRLAWRIIRRLGNHPAPLKDLPTNADAALERNVAEFAQPNLFSQRGVVRALPVLDDVRLGIEAGAFGKAGL